MFDNLRLERKIDRLERKLDLVIKQLGIVDPGSIADWSDIDELLQRGKKIQAIKRYRELDPAAGLAEARDAVEARHSRSR